MEGCAEVVQKARSLQRRPGDGSQIPGSGIVPPGRKAVGVLKVGVVCVEGRRPGIEALHKSLLTAVHRLGKNIGGLIGRGEHQCVEHVVYGELLPGLQIGGGAPGGQIHRLLADGHRPGRIQLLQCHQRSEQLGQAGRGHLPVGRLGVENLAAVRVHQHRRLGGKFRFRRRMGDAGKRRQRHRRSEQKQGKLLQNGDPFLWVVSVWHGSSPLYFST